MKLEEWMEFFRGHRDKKLFSTSDLRTLTGEERSSMSVQLSRLVRSGLVAHPVRGWYVNPYKAPTDEELAMVIRIPSYLSMEYALSRHDILSQRVHSLTLVTTRLPYTYDTDERIFEYHQIKRPLFWGYSTQNGIQIADPEKALLDLIYIGVVRGGAISPSTLGSLMDDMYPEDLDRKRLAAYARKFDLATRKILSEECGL